MGKCEEETHREVTTLQKIWFQGTKIVLKTAKNSFKCTKDQYLRAQNLSELK